MHSSSLLPFGAFSSTLFVYPTTSLICRSRLALGDHSQESAPPVQAARNIDIHNIYWLEGAFGNLGSPVGYDDEQNVGRMTMYYGLVCLLSIAKEAASSITGSRTSGETAGLAWHEFIQSTNQRSWKTRRIKRGSQGSLGAI